jgi:hypothetical protein
MCELAGSVVEETGKVARMTVMPLNGFDRKQQDECPSAGLISGGRA